MPARKYLQLLGVLSLSVFLSASATEQDYNLHRSRTGEARRATPYGISPNDRVWVAAQNGDPNAQLAIGERYASGQDADHIDTEAVRWFRLAAEQGQSEAQYKLAMMLEHAWGTRRDYQEALAWYKRAAEQNHSGAQNNIGVMYEKGRGMAPNYDEAVRWYTLAAENNVPTASFNLGLMYERGLGVRQDRNTALKYFQVAANGGVADARKKLSEMAGITSSAPKDRISPVEQMAIDLRRKPSRDDCKNPDEHEVCANPFLFLNNKWACTDALLYTRTCEFFYGTAAVGGMLGSVHNLSYSDNQDCGVLLIYADRVCRGYEGHPFCDSVADVLSLCIQGKFDNNMIYAK